MFTSGFLFGAILAFVTFAPKKPEDDADYETMPKGPFAASLDTTSLSMDKSNVTLSKTNGNLENSLNHEGKGDKGNQVSQPNREWLPVN